MTAPLGHPQIENICSPQDFDKLPEKSQANVYRIALMRLRQTPAQEELGLAELLSTYIPPDFPRQHSYQLQGTWCHLVFDKDSIEIPSGKDWKLGDITSPVALTLAISRPQTAVKHTVVWEASAETGTVAAQVRDIQVGLMAVTINAAKSNADAALKGMEKVTDLIGELVYQPTKLNLVGAETASSIGKTLTFLREKGATGELAKKVEQLEKRMGKTPPPLPPKPNRKKDAAPAAAPATQPGRSKLRPFLAVVGLFAVAGLAYSAYRAGLFTRTWRPS